MYVKLEIHKIYQKIQEMGLLLKFKEMSYCIVIFIDIGYIFCSESRRILKDIKYDKFMKSEFILINFGEYDQ